MTKEYTFNEYGPISSIIFDLRKDDALTPQQFKSLRGSKMEDVENFLRKRGEIIVEDICPCCGAPIGRYVYRAC
jgi:hypothetical protein